MDIDGKWKRRKSTLAEANTYFLIRYAILWCAVILMTRIMRVMLDILDSMYPFPISPDPTRFQFLRWIQPYAVTLVWVCKLPAVLPCWRDKRFRIIYQSNMILDGMQTLNLTLQLLVAQELPDYLGVQFSPDIGVLTYSTAAMLLWQEAGVCSVLLSYKPLTTAHCTLLVLCMSLGAWSALAADSFLSPVFAIVMAGLTMYVTYVSSLPIIL